MAKQKLRGRGGKLVASGHKEYITAVACSRDSTHVASAGEHGELLLWEPWQSKPLWSTQLPMHHPNQLCWLPDNERLFISAFFGFGLVDATSGALLKHVDFHAEGLTSFRAKPLADGRSAWVYHQGTSSERVMSLWSLEGERFLKRCEFVQDWTTEFDVLPDGGFLGTKHNNTTHKSKVCRVCRCSMDGSVLWEQDYPIGDSTLSLRALPDGQRFVVSSHRHVIGNTHQIHIASTADGQLQQKLEGIALPCFSPDERWFVAEGSREQDGDRLFLQRFPAGDILWSAKLSETCFLTITPDGTTLIAGGSSLIGGGNDKKLRYWDLSAVVGSL